MPYLSEDVLSIVLSKSCVKSLLRFRCVSKSWLNLIESSYFINLHLNHNKHNSDNIVIVAQNDCNVNSIYALEFDVGNNINAKVEFRNLEPHPIPFDPLFVLACNSLLCFSSGSRDRVEFWNPSTHKHRQVLLMATYNNTWSHRFGFGYDYRSDDYKLVMLEPCRVSGGRDRKYIHVGYSIQVYSLKSNSWRPGPEMPKKNDSRMFLDGYAVYASDVLHWIDHYAKQDDSGEAKYEIVAFDLGTEKWVTPPPLPPLPAPIQHNRDLILSNHSGSLCAGFHYKDNDRFDFWIMIHSCWSKLFTIQEPQFQRGQIIMPNGNLKKMNPHKLLIRTSKILRKERTFIGITGKLKWYDIVKQTAEDVDIFGELYVRDVLNCYQGLAPI